MKATKPFLMKFARTCLSPGRAEPNTDYVYDYECDMVRHRHKVGFPAAIDLDDGGPMTKKADIEKGDDTKDRRMWQ